MSRTEASELVHSLFDRWYPVLLRYALRATGSPQVSEDLVQETFMLLYRAIREGQKIENPKGWTLCVVRRQIGRQLRRSWREIGLDESMDVLETLPSCRVDPQWPVFEDDRATRLFSVLTRREEEVILLRMQAMKYREIGSHLGISPSSVNTLLARALRKLQKAAQKNAEGEPVANALEKALSKTLH
jgi:RNA polymerase sigma-70 factor, ECF subfamily